MSSAYQPPIYSEFGCDPEMAPLVEMFVEEIPSRIEVLCKAMEARDMDLLIRTAHQMKGAVGSYGFDRLTPYASAVESAVRARKPESDIEEAVRQGE